MYEIIPVGSVPGGDGFLLVTPEKAALIDGSFAFTAPKMINTIKGILKDRPLDYVLLTHTHYDHRLLQRLLPHGMGKLQGGGQRLWAKGVHTARPPSPPCAL